jgi:transcription factor STE12
LYCSFFRPFIFYNPSSVFDIMVLKNPSYSPIITVKNNDSAPTKPTNNNESERLAWIDELKLFLATAASSWDEAHDNNNDYDAAHPLKKFHLPTGESISCVLWEGFYLITGTDIVRSLHARFHAFGRPVTNTKKFEEGVFSDLRNLKPGLDARLEDPKSDLLEMLYKNDCIRTQKKQKVFFWYSVPHDRLFLDALERDLKREKLALAPSTMAVAEPAMSTCLNTAQTLLDQLKKATTLFALALEDEPTTTDSVSALGKEKKTTFFAFLSNNCTGL